LWKAILRRSSSEFERIDVVRVGDPPDLPLGSKDSAILLWAEREDRILVSTDRVSLPGHLEHHLNSGHHSPGIFAIRRQALMQQVILFLAHAANDSESWEWRDRIEYIP
jgi:hypothetical protein